MIWVGLAIAGLLLALVPTMTFLANLSRFSWSSDQAAGDSARPSISVLIPARDEEQGIRATVLAALESEDVGIEVVVLDDHSTDRTASIVGEIASSDSRVRCQLSRPLPEGWNGKQHACLQLAEAARYERLVFLDADVRLCPQALAALVRRQDETDVALLSAFPHQQTGTLLEKLIIPLMHFILLGFLPFSRMRRSAHPAYAAGCGQLFMTRIEEYRRAGTHAAIRNSRHDGLMLPRAFRGSGLMTDVVDGTRLAQCRMYTSAAEVVRGVLKNASEGIANPRLIFPFTVLLLGGSVLPMVTFLAGIARQSPWAVLISLVAIILGHLPRLIAALKFQQPAIGVLLHGVSVIIFVALQWVGLVNHWRGRQVAWRGRTESIDQTASTT